MHFVISIATCQLHIIFLFRLNKHISFSSVSAEEDGDVTIVASQLRGYGVWDGGMASGGALLDQWEGPSPSVLFLWVTDAQANLLQRELSAMMTLTTPSTTTCELTLFVLLRTVIYHS